MRTELRQREPIEPDAHLGLPGMAELFGRLVFVALVAKPLPIACRILAAMLKCNGMIELRSERDPRWALRCTAHA